MECGLSLVLFQRVQYCYYVLLLNVLTNPLLNFIMLLYFSYIGFGRYFIVLHTLEVMVVVGEGLLFAKLTDMKIPKALLVSLLLNAGSYLVGVWVL